MQDRLFTFGKPAKGPCFTDREKETAHLVSNFRYGVNTFILSPRRWGKTSLVLKAIEEMKPTGIRMVLVDVHNCKNPEQFCEKLTGAVLSQTAGRLDEAVENAKSFLGRVTVNVSLSPDPLHPLNVSLGMRDKMTDMEEMLGLPQRIAERLGTDIVVCVDEFQQIGDFNDTLTFQKTLRSLWQHQDNVTYCLFGSRRHMMESLFDTPGKPFYKFGDVMYLDCIPLPYWTKYIGDRFRREGKTITEDLCRKLCESVGYNSSYIQQLSWYLFLQTEDTADEDGLEAATEELVAQNAPIFESRTESLTAYQMNLLRAVACGVNSGLSRSEVISRYRLGSSANVTAIVKVLTEKDFIQESDGKTTLTDPVFGMWIKRI